MRFPQFETSKRFLILVYVMCLHAFHLFFLTHTCMHEEHERSGPFLVETGHTHTHRASETSFSSPNDISNVCI